MLRTFTVLLSMGLALGGGTRPGGGGYRCNCKSTTCSVPESCFQYTCNADGTATVKVLCPDVMILHEPSGCQYCGPPLPYKREKSDKFKIDCSKTYTLLVKKGCHALPDLLYGSSAPVASMVAQKGYCGVPVSSCSSCGWCTYQWKPTCAPVKQICDKGSACIDKVFYGPGCKCNVFHYKPENTTCEGDYKYDPSNPCDAPDTCNAYGECVDQKAPADKVCRPAAGPCDEAETCSGKKECPPDVYKAENTTCDGGYNYDIKNPCDAPDTCNDSGVCVDRVAGEETHCRDAAGCCGLPANCDGTTKVCPAGGYKGEETVCATITSSADCFPDKNVTCSGKSSTCDLPPALCYAA